MNNRTHIGLDVHKETTAVAVLRPGSIETDNRIIPTSPEAYRKLVRALQEKETVFCYEAGPCGFDPYRMLTKLGASCEVIAPTLVPRRSGQRVKTDRIDATKLARLHRAGELTPVRVPTAEEEALRDLIRLREDAKGVTGVSPSSASSHSFSETVPATRSLTTDGVFLTSDG